MKLVDARKGTSVTKNLHQYSWIDSYLMVTGPLVVELTNLTLVFECHPEANVQP